VLLAIDTSAGTSAAVVDDRGVLAEDGTIDTMRHAELIGDVILAVLADAGVTPGDLSGVAAGMGPGPFTGLRVGIAAARTFALGIDRPLLPVVSHDAIAFAWYREGGSGRLLVTTDARRRETYWSRYDGVDAHGLPVRSAGPGLARPDDVPVDRGARLDAASVSAGALGLVAQLREAAGHPVAVDEPLYLRSPDVTLAPAKRVSG
jgi:tRNA threonylcarbamoyladenosine biosynthesis protein TsaB